MRRRGLSVLEIVVGLTILSLGVIPLFQLFSGTRGIVGASREMLQLENRAMQVLDEGRALVHAGQFDELDPDQEEVLELAEGGVRSTMVVTRLAQWKLFHVAVRSEGEDRFFEVAFVVADPLASVQDWEPRAPGEAPDHDPEAADDEDDGHGHGSQSLLRTHDYKPGIDGPPLDPEEAP